MALPEGTRLGPYEILSPIGAGGMGEVYRAKDTRLDRTVAIKVLPSHLSDDSELRQRFEREAKAVSSLNHPHICTVYDVGQQDGNDFLVMEYLEGETLAKKLTQGPMQTDEVLRYATQIADALDKAHRQGVVHRDLKPGNIMLTKAGAKLLDFGLAKLRNTQSGSGEAGVTGLPTQNESLTGAGTIMGTFQYMAPEQLEGKEADARTDIFAFGAVAYEMATGRKAFEGESQASLITAIMSSEPEPISALQPMTPPAIDHIVKRCLSKDRDDRFQTARDLTLELQWIAEGGAQPGGTTPAVAKAKKLYHLAWGLAVILEAVVSSIAVWNLKAPPVGETRPVTRFAIHTPETAQLAIAAYHGEVAISPDGKYVVYVSHSDGNSQLYVRRLDTWDADLLGGTKGGVGLGGPFFSPDGSEIGFVDGDDLRKVSVHGGPSMTVCSVEAGLVGASWGEDGSIIFGTSRAGLFRVSAKGGEPEALTSPDREREERAHKLPGILPGGRGLLFSIDKGQATEIAVMDL